MPSLARRLESPNRKHLLEDTLVLCTLSSAGYSVHGATPARDGDKKQGGEKKDRESGQCPGVWLAGDAFALWRGLCAQCPQSSRCVASERIRAIERGFRTCLRQGRFFHRVRHQPIAVVGFDRQRAQCASLGPEPIFHVQAASRFQTVGRGCEKLETNHTWCGFDAEFVSEFDFRCIAFD